MIALTYHYIEELHIALTKMQYIFLEYKFRLWQVICNNLRRRTINRLLAYVQRVIEVMQLRFSAEFPFDFLRVVHF